MPITTDDLNKVVGKFVEDTRIEVSETAQVFIRVLINSVKDDPHERWEVDDARLDGYYESCLHALPNILKQIAIDHKIKHRITLVDAVCWTGRNFRGLSTVIHACKWPFPDPGELPDVPMSRYP